MKKANLLLIVVFLFSFFSCKKDADEVVKKDVASGTMTDVQFTLDVKSPASSGKKADVKSDPVCSPYLTNYVKVIIDGSEVKIATFYVDGIMYTNTIRLTVGTHEVSEFTCWYDANTPDNTSDDVMLSAVPKIGSDYATYVVKPLNAKFDVQSDQKTPLYLETVCYTPTNASKFGFAYWDPQEVIIREMNFFGDFCIKHKSDYKGSDYEKQTNFNVLAGEYYDAPAIALIEVWRKQDGGTTWIKQGEFKNSLQGETIKVKIGDYKNKTDYFKLKLFILVKQGTAFAYKEFTSWEFQDDQRLQETADGNGGKTVYYCLGSCTPSANYIFPAYLNLPPTATYMIVGAFAPGSLGAYVDAKLTNIATGYEIANGLYASNCADHEAHINVGQAYNMDIFSSLYPQSLPLFANTNQWKKINWLINHIGLAGTNNKYPGYVWSDVQGAIWLTDQPIPWNGVAISGSGVPSVTPIMTQMVSDMNANYSNYVIPTGGWACIVFIPTGTAPSSPTPTIQTMFIKVDP